MNLVKGAPNFFVAFRAPCAQRYLELLSTTHLHSIPKLDPLVAHTSITYHFRKVLLQREPEKDVWRWFGWFGIRHWKFVFELKIDGNDWGCVRKGCHYMDVHDGRGKGEKRGGVGFLNIGPCFFPSNSQTPIKKANKSEQRKMVKMSKKNREKIEKNWKSREKIEKMTLDHLGW